jgi:hypothetical protein
MGCHPSNWQTHIFQDGYCTPNQIIKYIYICVTIIIINMYIGYRYMIDITCAFLKGGFHPWSTIDLEGCWSICWVQNLWSGTPQPILGDLGDPLLKKSSFLGNGRPAIKGISVWIEWDCAHNTRTQQPSTIPIVIYQKWDFKYTMLRCLWWMMVIDPILTINSDKWDQP